MSPTLKDSQDLNAKPLEVTVKVEKVEPSEESDKSETKKPAAILQVKLTRLPNSIFKQFIKNVCGDSDSAKDLICSELHIKQEPNEQNYVRNDEVYHNGSSLPTSGLNSKKYGASTNQIAEHIVDSLETNKGSNIKKLTRKSEKPYKIHELKNHDDHTNNDSSRANVAQDLSKDPSLLMDNKYKCTKCTYSTHQAIILKVHMEAHSAPKSFKCASCHYMTANREDFTVHSRIHTGEKPYICDICDKKFNYRHSLKNHIRIHTGVKPYICEFRWDAGGLHKVLQTLNDNVPAEASRHTKQLLLCIRYQIHQILQTLDDHVPAEAARRAELSCPGGPANYTHVTN
ncbi:hypothetical protein NE865_15448 [Phthorimaea operculella]|nr:hypothetical protein NE865_15448 [Phthorimaea operculella]